MIVMSHSLFVKFELLRYRSYIVGRFQADFFRIYGETSYISAYLIVIARSIVWVASNEKCLSCSRLIRVISWPLYLELIIAWNSTWMRYKRKENRHNRVPLLDHLTAFCVIFSESLEKRGVSYIDW